MRSGHHVLAWVAGAVIVAAVASAAVCGSETPTAETPAAKTFVFTPVPYTYYRLSSGTQVPLSLPAGTTAANCAPYVSDEVDAVVEQERLADFGKSMAAYGFTIHVYPQSDAQLPANVAVHVPPGSALAAAPLVRAAPGVITADTGGLLGAPEAPPLPVCPTSPAPLPFRGGSCRIETPGQVCTPTARGN